MKKSILAVLVLVAFASVSYAANTTYVSILSPTDNQLIPADEGATTIVSITGTVSNDNGNARDFIICANESGNPLGCDTTSCFALSNSDKALCPFSIPVQLNDGEHTIQVVATKDEHYGTDSVTFTVVRQSVECSSGPAPTAWANQYLSWLSGDKASQAFAKLRGKVIRQIAQNHAEGIYTEECGYNYTRVEFDVDQALIDLL